MSDIKKLIEGSTYAQNTFTLQKAKEALKDYAVNSLSSVYMDNPREKTIYMQGVQDIIRKFENFDLL